MPFKSEKQRKWMWANKPELAEEFERATPKGKKLPKRVKKKSFLERIRLVLAEEPVVQPEGEQEAPQQQFDVGTLVKMIPQIMGQLDSSDVNVTKEHLINDMKVDPSVAEQAVSTYAVKIYNEEKAKRKHKLVMDVAKKLGMDPDKVKGWDSKSELPPLSSPGAAMLDRAIRLGNIVRQDAMKRYASVDNAIDAANNATTQEKMKNLISFFQNNSIEEGVNKIMNLFQSIKSTIPENDTVTAKMSNKMGIVSAILWAVTFFLALGAAGESDFNARYWHLNPDKADEFTAMAAAFSSMGLAGITQAISAFFKKREDKEARRHRAYQGEQLG